MIMKNVRKIAKYIDTKVLATYFGIVVITIFGLSAIQYLDISYPMEIMTSSRSTELSVVGEGKIEAIPDTAVLQVGISVDKEASVEDAQAKINEVHNEIVKGMKGMGIPEENIETSQYNVYPYSEREIGQPDGYSANAIVSIKTHDITQVNLMIEIATRAGANTVQGVQFSIDDPAQLRNRARNKAIENATAEAQNLANQLGIKLGKVTNIVESGNNPIQPYAMEMSAKSFEGDASLPSPDIQAGSQTITSTVTLFFEKK